MADVDPSRFYTGIVARVYAPLRSAVPDPEPYARFVERSGAPALELGCGDGDPLLELRRRGLDVEGLDSSLDMLDRCRARAQDAGIDVVLHQSSIETMALGRRYRSIYLAGPTFNLLPDDDVAARALARIADHLDDGGSALVPLFVPEAVPSDQLGVVREHVDDDGARLRVSTLSCRRDDATRTQTSVLRYEIATDHDHVVDERSWVLHWYDEPRFRSLVRDAGLDVARVLGDDARQQTFVLTRA